MVVVARMHPGVAVRSVGNLPTDLVRHTRALCVLTALWKSRALRKDGEENR